MSRRKKKSATPSNQADELGGVIEEETGISLSDLGLSPSHDSSVDMLAEEPSSDTHNTPIPSDQTAPQPHPPLPHAPDAGDHDNKAEGEGLLGMTEEYEKESLLRRIIPTLIGVVITVCILVVIGSGVVISRVLDAKSQADTAEKSFASFGNAIRNLDFRTVLVEFPKGHAAIKALERRVGEFQFADSIPWVGSSIRETYAALGVLDRIFTSGDELLSIVNKIGTVIFRRDEGGKTFELYMKTLTIEEKGTILKMITEALPTLACTNASLELALRDGDGLDQSKISGQLRDALAKARNGAQEIQSVISAWQPLAEVMPSFLGYPEEKTYLILLQDTSELRATGGFISHYGILRIHNGEITLLKTDNVYNLDDSAEHRVSLPPPRPVQLYFSKSIKKWYFRDANWSPDFIDSAGKSEESYHLEGGAEQHIDGVLAATPELIRSLLRFTGPVRVEGREYTADNFLENLTFEVREGNYRRGISEAQRKEIFGTLIAKGGDRLLDIPLTRWPELYKIIQARLEEKNLLLYFHDGPLQDFARGHNWTGEIRQTKDDFLMVDDTTLGTLKTESVMDKQVRYTMREDPDGFLVAHVELTYTNNGTFSDLTTRYRDWVRILVPEGSTLISSNGAQRPDGEKGSGALEVTAEHGTMQFGAYITVEPRYTKVFTLEYRLPDRIYQHLKQNHAYSLLLQKQPGNSHTRFQGNLMFLSPISTYAPRGFFNAKRSSQNLDIFSDMRTDQEFTVGLEKKSDENK